MALGSREAFALVALVGVAGTGLSVWLLNQVGLDSLGSLVWLVGYGTTVLVLWYGWIRPLDITGPTEVESTESSDASGDDTETTDS